MIKYIRDQKEYDNLISMCSTHEIPMSVRLYIILKTNDKFGGKSFPRRTQSWGYSQLPLVIREMFPELTTFTDYVHTKDEISFIAPVLKYYPDFIRRIFPFEK